ncbi:hypothetical protein P4639_14565 [Priestia megaterium]|uniref:hypothetical protein n=1 Tax=Priestia megaterium TaxID=1404 RepID=UPI002E23FA39|nr:hypothetical protein [Priestia megaterium]
MADFGRAAFDLAQLALRGRKEITPPSGLGYTPPFKVYRDNLGIYTDFTIEKYKNTGGQDYYVTNNGSDSNDGKSWSTAFSSMSKALSMADVGTIYVKFDLYDRNRGLSAVTITKSVNIIAVGGKVIFSAHNSLTWSLTSGQTYTYQAARSTVDAVWDAKTVDELGDYKMLTKRTSIAEVEANAGSWYTDGTTLYVHTHDNRIPDTFIRAYLAVPNGVINSGTAKVYLEGVTFEGGIEPLKVTNGNTSSMPAVYAKKCKFKYGTQSNGATIQGADSFFVDCEAARNNLDGFNYHIYNNLKGIPVEINCVGRNNGYTTQDNNNGTTTHDAITSVRINGTYNKNKGPNVADVGAGKSWVVNSLGHTSTATTDVQNTNFQIDGLMWLDGCDSYNSPYDIATTTASSALYVRDLKWTAKFFNTTGASINPY